MVKALVLVGIGAKHGNDVFNEVKRKREVKMSMMIYGEYDAAFIIDVPGVAEIQDFVRAVRKTEGITTTVTMIEME
jgi:uncharacterized protein with GYD domain